MSKKQKEIFILAGEPSGDKLGADLLVSLKAQGNFSFVGVGGQNMENEGIKSLYPMSDLSVMGLSDVLLQLPKLLLRNRQTFRYIIKNNPDIVVLIDSQVFSYLLAKKLRRAGYKNPIILYVAPSVWAWKPERAKKLTPLFDEVFAILPFEPSIMKKLNGPKTSFVGHPAMKIKQVNNQNHQAGKIAIFLGSRMGEVRRHLPIFKHLVLALRNHKKVNGFVLPTLPHLFDELQKQTADWEIDLNIITSEKDKEIATKDTILSVVSAGTISLEQAIANNVMVGTYIPDKHLLKHYIKAGKPMIALPNIILSKMVLPEIFPPGDKAQALIKAAIEMLDNQEKRKDQLNSYQIMRELLQIGEAEYPRQDPAVRVLAHLEKI